MSALPMQPGFASALRAADPAPPPGLRTWNGSDPALRFAVYRNNVRASLASALAEAFPVTGQLLGAEFFRAMALEYVQASPPRSPVLLEYGEDFGDFIADFAPAAQLPYLADVARLEQLRVQSFHSSDAPSLQAQDFQAWLARPEQLAGLQLRLHPSMRLLRSRFAVYSLWQAHQYANDSLRDAALATLELGQGEDILVWRPRLEVHARVLPPGAHACLLALRAGESLGEALQAASVEPGFALQPLLDLLVRDELVQQILS